MKVYRHISILLSVVFAVFLGHNLVPHHHHSEVVNVPVSSECPVDHGEHHDEDHDAESHPIHCHAFNDVVFDKYSTSTIQPQVRPVLHVIPVDSHTHLDSPARDGSVRYLCIKIPDKSLQTFGARSLRAPPVSV
jgi:hypothetical protein